MYKNNKILVVIPARSGSKGIKNKNIKNVKNKPLLVHSINYAKKCKFVDEIIVSTDSQKYAKISKKFGFPLILWVYLTRKTCCQH